MPAKKYIVRLSATERQQLKQLVKTGKVAAYKRLRAQILLKADIGTEGFGFKDKDIAASLDIAHRTVERTHQRSRALKLDGDLQAHLITLCCSEPPQGYSRWNLRLLAKTMVALDYVDSISPETVRQVLKKRHQTLATYRMVYTGQRKCRFCLCNGKHINALQTAP